MNVNRRSFLFGSVVAARGAWGSIFRVDFPENSGEGELSIQVLGDGTHAAFDNLAFLGTHVLLVGEDRGDTLHKQLNAFDSIWVYDVRNLNQPAARLLALGRDLSSEVDAALLDAGTAGFQNDGDNETTGIHYSDGSTTKNGILGRPTNPNRSRLFFTQQHGDNVIYEVITNRWKKNSDSDDE